MSKMSAYMYVLKIYLNNGTCKPIPHVCTKLYANYPVFHLLELLINNIWCICGVTNPLKVIRYAIMVVEHCSTTCCEGGYIWSHLRKLRVKGVIVSSKHKIGYIVLGHFQNMP